MTSSENQDPIVNLYNRNVFYQQGHHFLLRLNIVLFFVVCVLAGGGIYILTKDWVQPIYFPTTANGILIRDVALNEALHNDTEVLDWVREKAPKIMQFGYYNYRQHLQKVSADFTSSGFSAFTKAMQDSGVLGAILQRRFVQSMVIDGEVKIVAQGELNGVYTWRIKMPVIVYLDGVQAAQPIKGVLSLDVVRIPTLENIYGLAVQSWVVREEK